VRVGYGLFQLPPCKTIIFTKPLNYYFLVLNFSKLVSYTYFKNPLWTLSFLYNLSIGWETMAVHIINMFDDNGVFFVPLSNFKANLKPDGMSELHQW
jgi:hypothetical protein